MSYDCGSRLLWGLERGLLSTLRFGSLNDFTSRLSLQGAFDAEYVSLGLPQHHRTLKPAALELEATDFQSEQAGVFADVPVEVSLMIFAMLPFRDRVKAATLVCKPWRQLLEVSTLWENCDFADARGFTCSAVRKLFGIHPTHFGPKVLDPKVVTAVRYKVRDGMSTEDIKRLVILQTWIRTRLIDKSTD